MPSDKHAVLVQLAARWLRRNGCGVVATELRAAGCREEADAIGFRQSCSVLVEVKVSRSDFLADARKPERVTGRGLGVYRLYLSPPDVITPADLPPRWGLLHESKGRIVEVVRPGGESNIWPGYREKGTSARWKAFQHRPDLDAERSVLYSVARRLAARDVVSGGGDHS